MQEPWAAIAAYWTATFRGQLDEVELQVFRLALEGVEVEDAKKAIDYVAAIGGYPPTPQRIAELSEPYRKERRTNELELEKRPQLAGANHPISFKDWLETKATDKERAIVAKVSPRLAEKFGIVDMEPSE
jgi:hypothetical protein